MTPALAQALRYTRTWGFTPFGRHLLVNAVADTIGRVVWGTLGAIWRLPQTIASYAIGLYFVLVLADWINRTTNGRAGFWITAWDIVNGRVPR